MGQTKLLNVHNIISKRDVCKIKKINLRHRNGIWLLFMLLFISQAFSTIPKATAEVRMITIVQKLSFKVQI